MKRNSFCKKVLILLAVAIVALSAGNISVAFAAPIDDAPIAVTGRILTQDQTGDNSNWIEIAQSGDYSLIVRAHYLNIYQSAYKNGNLVYDDPAWQWTNFGATTVYENSSVRKYINAWFNGTAAGDADKLPADARLRGFTMQNWPRTVGTSCNPAISLTDGFSKPVEYQVGFGDDIAFALSYSEAANFCSNSYYTRSSISQNPSSAMAAANYSHILFPPGNLEDMLLRSPGDIASTAAILSNRYSASVSGRVSQSSILLKGYVYPAVWVHRGVFEDIPVSAGPVIEDVPIGLTGRVLRAEMAGDTSDWIEIARNGGYSLIVRTNFLNIYQYESMYGKSVAGDPAWQYVNLYGPNTNYVDSNVRKHINNWFNGTAAGAADNLPADARLRDFSMQSNAKFMLGTCCSLTNSLSDGLSKPTRYQNGIGDDVAFVMSYSEAANFCSKLHFMRGPLANMPSPAFAVENHNRILFPPGYLDDMWLRSVGDCPNTVASMSNDYSQTVPGRVFQSGLNYKCYLYPAMWVDQNIFLW
ncbi:MAG: hypothetical protein FWH55_13595 [Oscillospiraceae bacterium]|nr:hypothetical protein [Oscillospiraceae bacterium]